MYSERTRSRCRHRKLCTSLSFDAIKSHFAPPMQGLHCTHFLKYQYPSTPHPLFPTYPRTVRVLRASTVLLFYTDQMNRVHCSEEALRSFTMAPCVVVERLEGNQRCSRGAVSEHAGILVSLLDYRLERNKIDSRVVIIDNLNLSLFWITDSKETKFTVGLSLWIIFMYV